MAHGFNGFWCLEISEISERELSKKEKKKFNTIKLENKLIGKGYNRVLLKIKSFKQGFSKAIFKKRCSYK